MKFSVKFTVNQENIVKPSFKRTITKKLKQIFNIVIKRFIK